MAKKDSTLKKMLQHTEIGDTKHNKTKMPKKKRRREAWQPQNIKA